MNGVVNIMKIEATCGGIGMGSTMVLLEIVVVAMTIMGIDYHKRILKISEL